MNAAPVGISVLLPVYFPHTSASAIRLLRLALESIVEQSYGGELEILVIDDGSPRPVESHAADLGAAAGSVRWLRLPHNRGIVGALNAGIAAARHGWLARLDADDQWLPGKLDAQIAELIADPDVTIAATGMLVVTDKGEEIATDIRPADWSAVLRFFVDRGCPFPHGSVVARRDIYRLLGGYPHDAGVRHCEDYALWGTWLRFFKPIIVERALYRYQVASSAISLVHRQQQARASAMVRQRFDDLNLSESLPHALPALAEALGGSLFTAGVVAHAMWHHGAVLGLPMAALLPLADILPDRLIDFVPEAPAWHVALNLPACGSAELAGMIARPYR